MNNPRFKTSILASCCFVAVSCANPKDASFPHLNESLPIEQRVQALIDEMTLQEKIGQLFDKSPAIERLQVPEYNWWNESLHGVARAGTATVFPQAIGLAATFDEELIYQIATAISDEGRAKHHAFLREGNRSMYTGLTYWSPNVNIFRDPRWGRGQETYGEDPYLTTRIAVNFVNGLQGDDDKYLKSVATLKHYAVHSGPEVSRHSDDYRANKKDLAETYFPAFKDTIEQTNVASIMCAYNSVNGTPACGSNELIQNQLRGEFRFNGYMVSDCGAIADFYDKKSHNIVHTEAEAAAMALKVGTDLNCGDHHGNTFSYLYEAVDKGLVSEADIDVALTRLMTARFKLGMFDQAESVPFAQIPDSVVGSEAHLDLTLQAAEKSLVLLKNDGILPLKGSEKVALIGPNADNLSVLVGNYHGKPVNPVTPRQALAKALPENQLIYTPGSSLTESIYTHFEAVPKQHFFHTDHAGKRQSGLVAEYFAQPHFGHQPVMRRIDSNINFDWTRSPVDQSVEQEFSVRWRGHFKATKTATYEFKAQNLTFTLDGQAISGEVKLEAGKIYQFAAESNLHQYWHSNIIEPSVKLSWIDKSRQLQQEAIAAANKADVVVFVGGISANLEGEEMALKLDGFSHGDRTHIKLPKSQETLLKALHQTGKPIILVNMSGSAMALNWQQQNLDAIVQGFYPGEAAGTALTRLLFGQYSPSGKLPVTFYQGVSDLPDFKDYSMANRTYKYYKGEVLYPFGYGLSYADLSYTNAKASQRESGDLSVEVTLSNHSDFDAEEVIQVYVSTPEAPLKTPIRQLVAFKRELVSANSSQTVRFTIDKNKLSYIDEQGQRQVYKGNLPLSIGSGQGIKLPKALVQTVSVNLP